MDNEKITIDGKEYTLVNIKSIKVNNDENENIYRNEDKLSEDILLSPEILDKEVVNLSIQIDKN